MLKPPEIEISIGRAVNGDFIKVWHKPTGIFRERALHSKTQERHNTIFFAKSKPS
jgi:hypothetical protein